MKREKSLKERGQALVEFALILPVLMLIVAGIFDFGRILFTYAQASQQLRVAVREAPTIGFGDENTLPYLQCEDMMKIAQDVYFTENPPEVKIHYIDDSNALVDASKDPCGTNNLFDDEQIENGYMIRIESTGTIRPVFNQWIPEITFNFVGQRTIVKSISIGSGDPRDEDYDGMIDEWEEICLGGTGESGLEDHDNDGQPNAQDEWLAGTPVPGEDPPYVNPDDC